MVIRMLDLLGLVKRDIIFIMRRRHLFSFLLDIVKDQTKNILPVNHKRLYVLLLIVGINTIIIIIIFWLF